MPSAARSQTRRWTGHQAAGSRAYTEADARRVVAALTANLLGRENAMSAEDFAAAYCSDLSPRAVRAIVSDRDGLDYLLVNEGVGAMYCATDADEADATTRKLHARATSELGRVARRKAFAAAHLPRVQGTLGL